MSTNWRATGAVLGGASALCLSAFPAVAQTPAPAPAAEGVTSFDADYFQGYNPVTAADMVARIPGFELREGDDRRGFGATAGNLLINGERPSSKATPTDQLKRIPASSVVRIELLSGSSSASDVRGQSQLVNVVVRTVQGESSPTTFVVGARHIEYSNRVGWIMQASRTLRLSPSADLALDVQVPNLLGRGESSEVVRNGAGVITATREQFGQPANIGLSGSAALTWRPGANDTVHVNLQYAPTWNQTDNNVVEFAPDGSVRSTLIGHTDYFDNSVAELGADWEHRFSPGFSVKLLGLVSNSAVDQVDTFDTLTPVSFSRRTQERSTENGERVLRGQLSWAATPRHTIEFGAEGAFNYRDTSLDIATHPLGGVPVPVPLAVADARVEEVRAETFITDIWTLSPTVTLEAGFNYEVSRISQTGDQVQEREFSYPKPRFTLTWAPTSRNTLRFSVQRDVSQLDFAEFSSAVDFVNTSSTLGNPDLVPEKAWKSRLEWDTRFGERTAFFIALFHDQVEDVHDLVELGGVDAYGNIGDGTRTGVEIRGALPLRSIIPNADLRFAGLAQRTRVTDPITGETRSFSVSSERQGTPPGSATVNAGNKDWAYTVSFRQELPPVQSAWGFSVTQWAGREEFRRAESISYVREDPRLELFFETKLIQPLTVRVYVNNILSPSEERIRTFYQGDRSSGVIDKVETRKSLGGPEGSRSFGIQMSGRF